MDTVTPHRFTGSLLQAFGTFWSRSQPSWWSAAGSSTLVYSWCQQRHMIFNRERVKSEKTLYMNVLYPRNLNGIPGKWFSIIHEYTYHSAWWYIWNHISYQYIDSSYIVYILSILSFLWICNLIEQSILDGVVGGKRGWLTLGNGLTTDNWDKEAAMKRLESVGFKAQMMAGTVMKIWKDVTRYDKTMKRGGGSWTFKFYNTKKW